MERRIKKLRDILGEDSAFISGGANIFYYSGFTSCDAKLLITPTDAFIFCDSRYYVQAKEQAKGFTIVKFEDGLKNLFSKTNSSKVLFEEDKVTVGLYNRLSNISNKTFTSGSDIISSLRRKKDDAEIKKISEAERLGDEAFSHILQYIKEGVTEREIAIELEFFMRKNGASALSFETIAASGTRSAMPHGTASDKPLKIGDLFTLDFGCVLDGYCSDMTRTVGIGRLCNKSREIYNTVLLAQESVLSGIKCGMSCADADALARDIIKKAGYAENFGHSLGHSVGIEIHEHPNLSPNSKEILECGNVVTVEPGIYIEDFGGVRIEDVIVIGENYISNLTRSPKELIIL